MIIISIISGQGLNRYECACARLLSNIDVIIELHDQRHDESYRRTCPSNTVHNQISSENNTSHNGPVSRNRSLVNVNNVTGLIKSRYRTVWALASRTILARIEEVKRMSIGTLKLKT